MLPQLKTVQNDSVEFKLVTGTVLSSEKRSESYTYSTGGSGYVVNGTGYVSAPRIKTEITHTHEIWVRDDEGKEMPVVIPTNQIPLRVDQKLTLLYARNSHNERWTLVKLRNHHSNQEWTVMSALDVAAAQGFAHKGSKRFLLRTAIFTAVGVFGFLSFFGMGRVHSQEMGMFLAISAFWSAVLSLILEIRHRLKTDNKLTKAFDSHVTQIWSKVA